jgi:histone deacetylase 1/2
MIRDRYQGKDKIHTTNGEGMDISHIGHSSIQTPNHELHLKNILLFASATKNLLSVHKLAIDNNAFLEFYPWYFLIKNRATRKTLLRGRCEGGLYPIVASSSSSTPKQVYVVTKPTVERWHSRLDHPSSLVVQQVLNKFCLPYSKSSSIETVCDSCQKAKSHQLAYPISTSVSTIPLQQIFSDVWGPAPTSVGHHNYYVSFIDDYSKFTWIYLIKKKSDVFHNFMNFVEQKFSRKIITMQTDWGGEYEKLNPFFQKLGITHHVSCPHAHQQNGSVERKHRHIVEVGLALLANASMPLKFWDEAFLTATYLINLVPSKVINNTSPVERLLETKPDYKSLRVFGCTCWPNLRPYNSRKLTFRSKQCVFLGYSPHHKGVKCLEISTGRVYISQDVVFDENVFPFASLHPNVGTQLRKELLLLPNHLVSSNGGLNNDDHMPNNCSPMPAVSPCRLQEKILKKLMQI